MTPDTEPRWKLSTILNLTSASSRQIDYWRFHGLLARGQASPGSGRRVDYSALDVVAAQALAALSEAAGTPGLSWSAQRSVVEAVAEARHMASFYTKHGAAHLLWLPWPWTTAGWTCESAGDKWFLRAWGEPNHRRGKLLDAATAADVLDLLAPGFHPHQDPRHGGAK